jgi:hypothetical protein
LDLPVAGVERAESFRVLGVNRFEDAEPTS